jgi:hypothetical protein
MPKRATIAHSSSFWDRGCSEVAPCATWLSRFSFAAYPSAVPRVCVGLAQGGRNVSESFISSICGASVEVTTCERDEHGQPVHEICCGKGFQSTTGLA